MKDKKLNNLLGMENFSSIEKINKKAKKTKRTEVAKDVLQEQAYVVGKDVTKGKLKNKETHITKGLNNLISLSDFTKNTPATKAKSTKRTDVAKDILNEKKKKEAEECEDDKKKVKNKKEDKEKSGLTAAQRKLPEGLQKAILKKQGKK